ncbi:transposase domain-containing protein [Streptomyces sp. NPDC055085]
MQEKSVITRTVEAAGGVYAPGHLGELTQTVDCALVDAVIEETGSREKRLRLLPSRVVVYFVLALALRSRSCPQESRDEFLLSIAHLDRPASASSAARFRWTGIPPNRATSSFL